MRAWHLGVRALRGPAKVAHVLRAHARCGQRHVASSLSCEACEELCSERVISVSSVSDSVVRTVSAACWDGVVTFHRGPDGLARGIVRGATSTAVVRILRAPSGHERWGSRGRVHTPIHPGGWYLECTTADGVGPPPRDIELLRYVPTYVYLCVSWAWVVFLWGEDRGAGALHGPGWEDWASALPTPDHTPAAGLPLPTLPTFTLTAPGHTGLTPLQVLAAAASRAPPAGSVDRPCHTHPRCGARAA